MFSRFMANDQSECITTPGPSKPSTNSGLPSSEPTEAKKIPTHVLIQRLIILHDGLMPLPENSHDEEEESNYSQDNPLKSQKCHKNGSKTYSKHKAKRRRDPQALLSEDASLKEHAEFILYYHNHSLHSTRHLVDDSHAQQSCSTDDTLLPSISLEVKSRIGEYKIDGDRCTEEAVRFAGICRALRSLPKALQPQSSDNANDLNHCSPSNESDSEDEYTESDEIYLSHSTLIFVPLELDGDIFAVVQVPRTSTDQLEKDHRLNHCKGHGADSASIRNAIRRSFSLFSLIHGGGIHQRLLQKNSLNYRGVEECEDSTYRKKINASDSSLEQITITNNANNVFDDNYCDFEKCSNYSHTEYQYEGMEELFQLYRKHRKLSKLNNADIEFQKNEQIFNTKSLGFRFGNIVSDSSPNDCNREIENLLHLLPISSLRNDLAYYYDNWLGKMQGICDLIEGGVGRSVVELVPPPVKGDVNLNGEMYARGQHPPSSLPPFLSLAAVEFIKSLLVHKNDSESPSFHLFGVSFFYQNRHIASEMLQPNDENINNKKKILPPEIPCMLSEYIYSQQRRKSETACSMSRSVVASKEILQVSSSLNSKKNQFASNPLGRWLKNLSVESLNRNHLSKKVHSSKKDVTCGFDADINYFKTALGFITPPEQSALTAHSSINSLSIPEIESEIWIPRVYLPWDISSCRSEEGKKTETHVALFEHRELGFLLYFNLSIAIESSCTSSKSATEIKPDIGERIDIIYTDRIHTDAGHFGSELLQLKRQITEFCEEYSLHNSASISSINPSLIENNSDSVFLGENGMDIIFIDRAENNFVLLSQHDLCTKETLLLQKDSDSNEKGQKQGFFGVKSRMQESLTFENELSSFHRSFPYRSMLDCRHKLAAYLPLDVMLAFDDIFSEIQNFLNQGSVDKQFMNEVNRDFNGKNQMKSIELCTYLSEGWVHGQAYGNYELYIFMDTNKFVTTSDVHRAVTRVRERIFNYKLL